MFSITIVLLYDFFMRVAKVDGEPILATFIYIAIIFLSSWSMIIDYAILNILKELRSKK